MVLDVILEDGADTWGGLTRGFTNRARLEDTWGGGGSDGVVLSGALTVIVSGSATCTADGIVETRESTGWELGLLTRNCLSRNGGHEGE